MGTMIDVNTKVTHIGDVSTMSKYSDVGNAKSLRRIQHGPRSISEMGLRNPPIVG